MPRVYSTRPSRNTFLSSLATALRIYAPVRDNCVWNYESLNESSFHPRVASKIVGVAFLSVVAAWEEYIEDVFLRYMAGGVSGASFAPKLRLGKCNDLSHARQVLTGLINPSEAARAMRWGDYNWALEKAMIFFHKGVPFSNVPTQFQQRLKDAQVIRNRVAHSSAKARRQFKSMTNLAIRDLPDSPMAPGFSPGRYLIYNAPEIVFEKKWIASKESEMFWGDIFECYSLMYQELADHLTPWP